MPEQTWKVGELAARTGLTVRTLHHYDAIGLLCPSGRTGSNHGSGHRLYTAADVTRLHQILCLKQLGFGLEQIKEYMFGSQVVTDWRQGSPITWKGTYEDKEYEDKGEILEIEPERRLRVTHFSPLSGQEDRPENYHTLSYELEERAGGTL